MSKRPPPPLPPTISVPPDWLSLPADFLMQLFTFEGVYLRRSLLHGHSEMRLQNPIRKMERHGQSALALGAMWLVVGLLIAPLPQVYAKSMDGGPPRGENCRGPSGRFLSNQIGMSHHSCGAVHDSHNARCRFEDWDPVGDALLSALVEDAGQSVLPRASVWRASSRRSYHHGYASWPPDARSTWNGEDERAWIPTLRNTWGAEPARRTSPVITAPPSTSVSGEGAGSAMESQRQSVFPGQRSGMAKAPCEKE